jgi:hypothetical protein
VELVQPADKEEIGDLLDDLERVGDAARLKAVPDAIDLAAKFARDH